MCSLIERMCHINTRLLALIPVISASEGSLFDEIESEIQNLKIPMKICIGFVLDGASEMVCINNSLWSRLKLAAPFCVQMKCLLSFICPMYSTHLLQTNRQLW